MYRHRPWSDESEDDEASSRQTASLAGVAVILFLLVVGLFLVNELRTKAAIEDCLMSGRRNCDRFVPASEPHLSLTAWLH